MAEPESADDLRPKPSKKRPEPGQHVYVPDRAGSDMLFGGLATVSSSSTKRTLHVDEDPEHGYTWWELQHRQLDLWAKFGTRRARVATHDEIRAWSERQSQATAAERERVAKAVREEWLPKQYPVLNRGLMAVPAWREHHRAKNWAAVLEIDPTCPGGFKRKWFNRGNGPVFYIVPDSLEAGDAVEFGADYLQGSGKREDNRWYGVVVAVCATSLTLQRCPDAAGVALKSAELKASKSARPQPEATAGPGVEASRPA